MKRIFKWIVIVMLVLAFYQIALYELFQHTIRDTSKKLAQNEILPLAFIIEYFPYWSDEKQKVIDLEEVVAQLAYVERSGDVDYGVKYARKLMMGFLTKNPQENGMRIALLRLSNRKPELFVDDPEIKHFVDNLVEHDHYITAVRNRHNDPHFDTSYVYIYEELALYYAVQLHDPKMGLKYITRIKEILNSGDYGANDVSFLSAITMFYWGIAQCENGDGIGANEIKNGITGLKPWGGLEEQNNRNFDLFYLNKALSYKNNPNSVCREW